MSKVYVYRCIKLYVPFSTTVSTLLLQYVLLFATLCVSYLTFRAFRWNNLALYVTLERCHNITPGAGCRQAKSPWPMPSRFSLRENLRAISPHLICLNCEPSRRLDRRLDRHFRVICGHLSQEGNIAFFLRRIQGMFELRTLLQCGAEDEKKMLTCNRILSMHLVWMQIHISTNS